MLLNHFDKGVFLANLLAVVIDPKTKKILIGRRENDPYLPQLSWCFPGGRPDYKGELEDCLKGEVRAKTNLNIDVKQVIFAKTYPEKREFLSIYYLCEASVGEEKAGESFVEVKWIAPEEVTKYFTTSLHPKLLEILKKL